MAHATTLTLSIAQPTRPPAGRPWPWPPPSGRGTGDPDAHLPDGFAGDRLGFTLAELVPLAAVLLTPSLLIRRRR